MKNLITAVTAASFAVTIAFAQDKPPGPPPGGEGGHRPKPEEVFKKLDSNGDNSVSLDEFKAGPRVPKDADKAREVFGKIDKDGSGGINLEEFKAHRPPHGPGGRPGGPGGQGGSDAGGGGPQRRAPGGAGN